MTPKEFHQVNDGKEWKVIFADLWTAIEELQKELSVWKEEIRRIKYGEDD